MTTRALNTSCNLSPRRRRPSSFSAAVAATRVSLSFCDVWICGLVSGLEYKKQTRIFMGFSLFGFYVADNVSGCGIHRVA